MNQKSPPPLQSQSARSGGWKSFIQLPQSSTIFFDWNAPPYTSFDSRIWYSQYFAPPYLFFFRDCLASYFFALAKMPFSLITHILRGSTTIIRPSWHFFLFTPTPPPSQHSRAIIRQASKKRVSHNYPKSATHYPHTDGLEEFVFALSHTTTRLGSFYEKKLFFLGQ